MKNTAISVHDLHKSFTLPEHKVTSLKQAFLSIGKRRSSRRQVVLDGVTFDVKEGDFIGIVGKNGSGKSTLLKMLAGVYVPDAGSIQINGNVTPFIELGVGFNPELSGRDNVYLSASLLGFDRKAVDAMYESIVNFAELEEHMEKKLKNYSSGMQVRLAFSIAVMAKNDILIFDEVLAVGDEAFQQKCTDIFERYKATGQTVVLVTHDMASVKKFCNKAILLENGKIISAGDPRKVADLYSKINTDATEKTMHQQLTDGKDDLLKVKLNNQHGKPSSVFKVHDPVTVKVEWPKGMALGAESIGITLVKNTGEHVTGINSRVEKENLVGWQEDNGIYYEINLDVYPGKYHFIVEIFKKPGVIKYAKYDGPELLVKSIGGVDWSGIVKLRYKWKKIHD